MVVAIDVTAVSVGLTRVAGPVQFIVKATQRPQYFQDFTISFYGYNRPAISAAKALKPLKNVKLISYPDFPHGMPTTEAAIINKELLAFIKS